MDSSFFSLVLRMKYINRWSLMRNTRYENLSEHSLEVAVLAHALAIIAKKRFNSDVNPDEVAVVALFHDVNEIITGDLPTPIKYYDSSITASYKDLEAMATERLLQSLPEDLKEEYTTILKCDYDEHTKKIVKAADKISALIKCVEEEQSGNAEFIIAKRGILTLIDSVDLPEVKEFMKDFFPAFSKTLDEQ